MVLVCERCSTVTDDHEHLCSDCQNEELIKTKNDLVRVKQTLRRITEDNIALRMQNELLEIRLAALTKPVDAL